MNLIAFDAFQGKWSDDIHREWTTHLVANGKDKKKVNSIRLLNKSTGFYSMEDVLEDKFKSYI